MSVDESTEGAALFVIGLITITAGVTNAVYDFPYPEWVFTAAVLLWLVWGLKWAAEGGIPPVMSP